MCVRIVPGQIGQEGRHLIRFVDHNERADVLVNFAAETLGPYDHSKFEWHVKSRQSACIYFNSGQVVD